MMFTKKHKKRFPCLTCNSRNVIFPTRLCLWAKEGSCGYYNDYVLYEKEAVRPV